MMGLYFRSMETRLQCVTRVPLILVLYSVRRGRGSPHRLATQHKPDSKRFQATDALNTRHNSDANLSNQGTPSIWCV